MFRKHILEKGKRSESKESFTVQLIFEKTRRKQKNSSGNRAKSFSKTDQIKKQALKSVQIKLLTFLLLQLILSTLNNQICITPFKPNVIVFANGAKTRQIPSGSTCLLPAKGKPSSTAKELSNLVESYVEASSLKAEQNSVSSSALVNSNNLVKQEDYSPPSAAANKLMKPTSNPRYFNELIQASQNTILYRNTLDKSSSTSSKQQQLQQRQLLLLSNQTNNFDQTSGFNQKNVVPDSPARYQFAFESICDGWRNSIEPDSLKPTAYWAFDENRGALVAKFIYYEKAEFLDISSREARLTSPIFHPIPAYHSMQDSKYYSSCKVSFRSYFTIMAYLELTLILVPKTTAAAAAAAASSNSRTNQKLQLQGQAHHHQHQQQQQQQQQQQSQHRIKAEQTSSINPTNPQVWHQSISENSYTQSSKSRPVIQSYQLAKLVEGKTPKGKQLAEKTGEWAAWTNHTIILPHNLGENSFYALEFSAMSGTLSSAALAPHNYLNGLAISNFSLSPECFGLNVDKEELERVKLITGRDPIEFDEEFLAKLNPFLSSSSTNENQLQNSSSSYKPILTFFETYKVAIVIVFILIIVIIVATIIATQCLLRQLKSNDIYHKNKKRPILLLSIVECLCCCRCYLFCKQHKNNRVYSSKQNNSNTINAQDDKIREEERNYLRPIQRVFENVELNENPNYVANGDRSLSREAIKQLKPYYIERKRLTLAKMLGNGAFGDVYQGFLLCYNTDLTDNGNNGNNIEYFDHLDSHSKKVAVKTLTEKRMDPADFITEAINMSLVTPHRNIVELIGVCFEDQPLYIVMELLEGGNLKDFLIANRDKSSMSFQSQNQISTIGMSPFKDCNIHNYGNDDYLHSDSIWPNDSQQHHEARIKLCMGDLLVFALDIARACDYLQKKRFIHRDLAARNCLLTSSTKRIQNDWSEQQLYVQENPSSIQQPQHLFSGHQNNNNNNQRNSSVSGKSFVGSLPSALEVNANYKVDLEQVFLDGYMNSGIVAKLADFGMTRDVKAKEYYSVKHKEMAVRWTPPEYLVDGVATTKSDVWSFGVFLWELFSMGQQPYQQFVDNQDVIKFIKSRRFAEPKLLHQQSSRTEPELVNINLDENCPAIVLNTSNNMNDGIGIEDEIIDYDKQNDLNDKETDALCFNSAKQQQQQRQPRSISANSLFESISDSPPLPLPHDNTPHPIYSIMCSCWATEPERRPDFEEIANRLYWCLQKLEVLETSLPVFYEPQLVTSITQSNLVSNTSTKQFQSNNRSESRQSNNTQTTQLNWPLT